MYGNPYYSSDALSSYLNSAARKSLFSAMPWQMIAGLCVALVCAVLLYVLVFPKKYENSLPKFFKVLRDFFDVRYLLIETIAKFIYVFLTLATIFVGFFLLFGETAGVGLAFMILGPIAHRLVYELFMMLILLVKNVMDINRTLKGGITASNNVVFTDDGIASGPAPEPEAPQVRRCPNCGAELADDDVFCRGCGTRV